MSTDLTKTAGLKYVQFVDETDAYRAVLSLGHLLTLVNALLINRIETVEAGIKNNKIQDDERKTAMIDQYQQMVTDQAEIEKLIADLSNKVLLKVETFAGSQYYKVTFQEINRIERQLMRVVVRWSLIDVPDGNKNSDYRPREV